MKVPDALARKKVVIGSAVAAVTIVVAGFYVLRRPPRVDMDRYVPAGALGFIEIDSLSDLADGLTGTKAWSELAPLLGLSSQIKQVGLLADLMGRTGLGPDEAVLAGRAQCAAVLTGIESQSGETEEGPFIHLRPDFALIVESHLGTKAVERLVRERAPLIAERIYGESIEAEASEYRGAALLTFYGPGPGHQLIASWLGSAMLIANQADAMKACLDTVSGRSASMADDSTLKLGRPEIGAGAPVFAYVTAGGLRKLCEIWPALIADRSPQTVTSFADLLQHISEQTGTGLLYASDFKDDGVTEKYLVALRPEVAAALAAPLKPASAATPGVLASIPESIERLTLLDFKSPGDLPERLLKQLAPNLDVVAGVALREFVISFRKQYGLEPSDSLGHSVGDQIALVNFGDENPSAMLLPAADKARLLPAVLKYLRDAGKQSVNQSAGEVEIMASAGDDRRAAAFVGENLVLGTREQILKIAETRTAGTGIDRDARLRQILAKRPASSSIVTYRPREEDAAPFLLAISKLTRVTDGSRDLLDRDSFREAIERLPRCHSFTEFREDGVFVETRSAVGSFGLIGSLARSDQE